MAGSVIRQLSARACLLNRKVLTGDDLAVTRTGVISEEFWAAVESVMPSDRGKRGGRFGDHRLMLEGIAWRFRTGSPWRDLPADFGPWQTVWKRHHRWSLDGTYDAMFAQVAASFGPGTAVVEDLETLLSVDSTSVRAHQHCAGARSDTFATGGSVELQEIRRWARGSCDRPFPWRAHHEDPRPDRSAAGSRHGPVNRWPGRR